MFLAYTISAVFLVGNLVCLWVLSGARRARSGMAMNPEDGARYSVPWSDSDPAHVARVLRAHRNAEADIYPFLILGLLYLLAGGTGAVAIPIFAVFVVARLAHSFLYLGSRQPGRTIAFAISLLALVGLIPTVLWAAFCA